MTTLDRLSADDKAGAISFIKNNQNYRDGPIWGIVTEKHNLVTTSGVCYGSMTNTIPASLKALALVVPLYSCAKYGLTYRAFMDKNQPYYEHAFSDKSPWQKIEKEAVRNAKGSIIGAIIGTEHAPNIVMSFVLGLKAIGEFLGLAERFQYWLDKGLSPTLSLLAMHCFAPEKRGSDKIIQLRGTQEWFYASERLDYRAFFEGSLHPYGSTLFYNNRQYQCVAWALQEAARDGSYLGRDFSDYARQKGFKQSVKSTFDSVYDYFLEKDFLEQFPIFIEQQLNK